MKIEIEVPENVVKDLKGIAANTPDDIISLALKAAFYMAVYNEHKDIDSVLEWIHSVNLQSIGEEILRGLTGGLGDA